MGADYEEGVGLGWAVQCGAVRVFYISHCIGMVLGGYSCLWNRYIGASDMWISDMGSGWVLIGDDCKDGVGGAVRGRCLMGIYGGGQVTRTLIGVEV